MPWAEIKYIWMNFFGGLTVVEITSIWASDILGVTNVGEDRKFRVSNLNEGQKVL